MSLIPSEIHSSKIHGCWLGKAIGGTLGTPHEGKTGPLALSFYDPVPTTSLPNDDLDLQVVWLHHLLATGARTVSPQLLADAWERHVLFPFDEYAVARRNRAWGLSGPAQGATDNIFGECMGAAIRSEVWACLAPGDPDRAVGFAWADAVVDHCGEGVLAQIFHTALQSAAFVHSDRDQLIEIGLSYLPSGSRLRQALLDTLTAWHASPDWRKVRDHVFARHYNGNFTDVVCNLCFELIGWLDGRGDFGRSICTAVNCGLDTDCTGATLGALLGILDPAGIPDRWRQPIGEEIVLSDAIVGFEKPADINELTDWTVKAGRQLAGCRPKIGSILPHQPAGAETSPHPLTIDRMLSDNPDIFSLQELPPMAPWTPASLFGFWSQWSAAQFAGRVMLLRLHFHLERPQAVKLMVFYKPRACAWIDRLQSHVVTQEALEADPFIAPSFHRAGPAATVTQLLESGPHELVLALEAPPAGKVADLAFGLADPETNLWLPHAFHSVHPAPL